jgi:nicotinamidase-related amidase
MKINSLRIFLSLALIWSAVQVRESFAADPGAKRAFVFRNTAYFHRWSKNDQHEFTPEKQEDLNKWSDMLTINGYPNVNEGDGLAATANAVLENYKSHQARVLNTRSVPRTADRPAEHLIAVIFTRPNFSEVAFARFKLMEGKGCSLVYSHRIYGEETADEMSAWLKANGPEVEKTLLEWSSMPSPTLLRPERL